MEKEDEKVNRKVVKYGAVMTVKFSHDPSLIAPRTSSGHQTLRLLYFHSIFIPGWIFVAELLLLSLGRVILIIHRLFGDARDARRAEPIAHRQIVEQRQRWWSLLKDRTAQGIETKLVLFWELLICWVFFVPPIQFPNGGHHHPFSCRRCRAYSIAHSPSRLNTH